MNALIIYDSLYGNTYRIADALSRAWHQYGHSRIVSARTAKSIDLLGIDLLAIGGPTQKHWLSPALADFLGSFEARKLTRMQVVAFDTRIQLNKWLSGSAADCIAERLQKKGISLLLPPESFFVETKEGPLMAGEAERAEQWAHAVLLNMHAPRLVTASR